MPSIRQLAGFLGINPNTVARAIEDLKRSGHVEARRGKGVFVASGRSTRPFATRREVFLKDAVIRAAALEMTPDEVAVAVLGLAASRGAVSVLLVECSPAELDFFGRELEAQLPVRVDKVVLSEMAGVVRRRKGAGRWRAAVTSFGHLPEVEHRLEGLGVPVVALLAETHLETLHRLVHLPAGTRVGVVSAERETAHNLEHSIVNAALPNIARVDASLAEGAALGRLVRRVDAIVCSSAAAARVQGIVGPTVPVIVDDRALNQRAIQMLGAILAQPDGAHPAAPPPRRAAPCSCSSGVPGRVVSGRRQWRGSPTAKRRKPDEGGKVMSVLMWVLVAVLAGLLAGFVRKRGSYGRGWDVILGLIGSVVVSWFVQSQWVAPDPGPVAVVLVAAVGAAGLIAAQRTIFPARV